MNGTTLATIIHGVLVSGYFSGGTLSASAVDAGIAIVAAATTLLALGDLDSTTAMALFAGAIGLVGGS